VLLITAIIVIYKQRLNTSENLNSILLIYIPTYKYINSYSVNIFCEICLLNNNNYLEFNGKPLNNSQF
jgi:hypothetical protein